MELREGYKPTEVGIIPKDWDIVTFADIADKDLQWSITGGPFGSNLKASDYVSEGVRIIQLQNIGDGVFHDDYAIYTTKQKADELISCNIYPDEIILSKMGDPVARACFVPTTDCRYVMASDGIRLAVDKKRFDKRFVFYYINSIYFRRMAIAASTGSTRQRIGLVDLKKLLFTFPPLPEQRAIAAALSDVDALLAALDALIAKKCAIKQGAMQELLRPKEDWEPTSLGSIADPNKQWSLTGGPFGSNLKSSDYTNEGVRIIQLQNIGDGEFKDNYEVYTSFQKANELLSCNIYPGEIILSKMGDPVARACIMPAYRERYLMCSDGIRLAVNQKQFNTYFVYTIINAPEFRIKAANASTGSTRKRIGLTELRNLELLCPPLPEQRAIATILSDMDAEIAALEAQRDKTRKLKQGMMQELLTGRIRLV